MKEIVIGTNLIKNLSVNHYLGVSTYGRYVKIEVKEWKETLGWLIKEACRNLPPLDEWKLPLNVKCDVQFPKDKRRIGDISNYSKVVLDAIQDVSGVNDRDMRWQDGDVTFGDEARLVITISEGE